MITHQISVLADFSILLTFFFWTLDIRPSVVLLPVFELHASQSMPGPLTSREGPHT